MTTFLEVVEALIASREHCAGSLGRMQFWVDQFGHLPITEVGEDDVDRALQALVARGKLKPGPNGRPGAGFAGTIEQAITQFRRQISK